MHTMALLLLPLVQGLVSWLGPPSLLAVVLYAVLTAKTLPLAWHVSHTHPVPRTRSLTDGLQVRLLYGFLRHYYFSRHTSIPVSTGNAPTLFQPTIYATTTPLGDLDYSLHKSNSTYLADLDLARGSHFFCLFRAGLDKYSRTGRAVFPALGGVTCTFKREIRPFEKIEIWTRVLSWDSKWIYLISHFVQADKARPTRYTDQSWRGTSSSGHHPDREASSPAKKLVPYATCISKYVVKQGRKTVPPDEFLLECGLFTVPEPPEATAVPSTGSATYNGVTTSRKGQHSKGDSHFGDSIARQIDTRRQRGLVLANHIAELDMGQDLFTGGDEMAFARY